MTKKDFELIASVLKQQRLDAKECMAYGEHLNELDSITHAFARVLALKNPKFNQLRFLKACGMEDK